MLASYIVPDWLFSDADGGDSYVYRAIIWEAAIRELECRGERSNQMNRYAVAVVKYDMVVGHVPQKISRLCFLFLRCGGNIICHDTGARKYSTDLPQGALEIPCLLFFIGELKEISKLKALLFNSTTVIEKEKK